MPRPAVYLSIGGRSMIEVSSAQWTLGRNDWFDVLTPNQATFTFVGAPAIDLGEEIQVTTDDGTLWIGDVDRVEVTETTPGQFVTTVGGTDIIGRLGKAVKPPVSVYISGGPKEGTYRQFPFAGDTLEDVANDILSELTGDTITVTIGDSAGTLPTLINWTDPPRMTALDLLNNLERTSNAMMALQSDGTIIIVMRDYLTAASVEVIDLAGPDTPYAWSTSLDRSNIINHWVLTQPAFDPTEVLDEKDTASIAAYGDHSYTVDDYLCDTATHFSAGMKAAMAVPRAVVSNASFHVTDLAQQVLRLEPLTWIAYGGDTWQVMSVSHGVSLTEWDVSITADVSQNAMAGVVDPDPEEPVTVTVDTQTITSAKSATVARTSDGDAKGNGAGDYLAVGYYDGYRARALIQFTISWPAGFLSVKKATLNLRTSDQAWVAFGSHPRVYAKRVTESWSEGSFTDAPGSQYSSGNAVIWPGPSRTSSGQALKSFPDTENNDVSIDITTIAQGWHDHGNHGLVLMAANEDSTTNTIEFYSDDHATSGWRPELVLKCEVEAP